jgi:chitinase
MSRTGPRKHVSYTKEPMTLRSPSPSRTAIRLITLFLLGVPSLTLHAAQKSERQIIAYVFPEDTNLKPTDIAANKLTRINYAFANIKDGRMVEGFSNTAQNLATLVALKQQNPSLTVLASVGGWTWSGRFSDAALTKQSRAIFIDSIVAFVDKYKLDGVDIDWEYPGQKGNGNRFRPEDTQNYTLLLKELRERFDHESKQLHRPLLISIATEANISFLMNTEMDQVQTYVDTVNLMAYDYYEPADDRTTGHHAPLFINPTDPKHISADETVQQYEQVGVPAKKIVLGVPFYGHVWSNVFAANHGLYQPGKAAPEAYATYANITSTMLNNGFTRYWDQSSSVPYLYNPTTHTFVSYEDPQSLALKCRFVLDRKLAGVMFWDYASDPSGTLLDTIDTTLNPSEKIETTGDGHTR